MDLETSFGFAEFAAFGAAEFTRNRYVGADIVVALVPELVDGCGGS